MTRVPLSRSIASRVWIVAPLAALSLAGLGTAAASSGPSRTAATPARPGAGVIVRARLGREAAAESLARTLGGTVRERLPIIDGFAATLPERAATMRMVSPVFST